MDYHIDKKVILSDETHFDFDGCINKQNYRIYGMEDTREICEKRMHYERVGVRCSF